jgi:hypothetical protein
MLLPEVDHSLQEQGADPGLQAKATISSCIRPDLPAVSVRELQTLAAGKVFLLGYFLPRQ